MAARGSLVGTPVPRVAQSPHVGVQGMPPAPRVARERQETWPRVARRMARQAMETMERPHVGVQGILAVPEAWEVAARRREGVQQPE